MQEPSSFLKDSVCWYMVLRDRNRQKLFLSERYYEYYLRLLRKYKRTFQIRIFAFCLLPADIQLILQPRCADQLAPFLHNVSESYELFFNTKHEPQDNLELYYHKNVLINSDEDLFERVRYIEYLPMGALISTTMAGYPWSSCAHRLEEARGQMIDKISFVETVFSRDSSPRGHVFV